MTFRQKSLAALVLATGLSGCSASGITGLETVVSGPIYVVDPTTGNQFSTGGSASNPYFATNGAFSIGIEEKNFGGPYTVTQLSFGGIPGERFNLSCFEPHTIDSSDHINVVRLSIDNAPTTLPTANPLTGQVTSPPSPCDAGEMESYLISDTHGHTANFYLEIP